MQAYGFDARVHLIQIDSVDDLQPISKAMGILRQRGALAALCPPASFGLSLQKRETLEAVLEYLQKHAKTALPEGGAPLPKSSLLGGLSINQDACTLCM